MKHVIIQIIHLEPHVATTPKKPARAIKINPKGTKFRKVKKRKNFILDQGKLDRAKLVFGVATETEAVDRALDVANDLAQFRQEVESGLSDLLGKGGFTDHFPSSLSDGD